MCARACVCVCMCVCERERERERERAGCVHEQECVRARCPHLPVSPDLCACVCVCTVGGKHSCPCVGSVGFNDVDLVTFALFVFDAVAREFSPFCTETGLTERFTRDHASRELTQRP